MTTEIISTITEAPHSRRGLLGLMAKALALTAIPATFEAADAKALTDITQTEESPELLALDDALYDVRRRLADVTARYEETIAIGKKSWPRAPEIIIAEHWHETRERDIRGEAFTHATRWDDDAQIKRYSTKDLENRKPHEPRKRRPRKPHTIVKEEARYAEEVAEYHRELAEWKERYAAAKTYEAEKDRVRQASGFFAARADLYKVTGDLRRICEAIANVEARTLAGLSIKASAVNAWMETEHAIFIDTSCTVWVMALLVNVLHLDGRTPEAIDDAVERFRSVEHYTWEAKDPARYDI